jgi:hypothetical protein
MIDLKKDLDLFFERQAEIKKSANELSDKVDLKIMEFIKDKVTPAFEEIKAELLTRGRKVETIITRFSAMLIISTAEKTELSLNIKLNKSGKTAYAVPIREIVDRKKGQIFTSQGVFRSGSQNYTIEELTKDELVKYIIGQYKDSLGAILLSEISESK